MTTWGGRSSIFRATKLDVAESFVAPGLKHDEAGELEEESRPGAAGFESVGRLRLDDRARRPRGCELTCRFGFKRLAARHDPVEGLGIGRHAKRVALRGGRRIRMVG
jgi:hypothetical protein